MCFAPMLSNKGRFASSEKQYVALVFFRLVCSFNIYQKLVCFKMAFVKSLLRVTLNLLLKTTVVSVLQTFSEILDYLIHEVWIYETETS